MRHIVLPEQKTDQLLLDNLRIESDLHKRILIKDEDKLYNILNLGGEHFSVNVTTGRIVIFAEKTFKDILYNLLLTGKQVLKFDNTALKSNYIINHFKKLKV